jgi:hypothetical protein
MKPEFTAHQRAPHQAVACASCHIAPGAGGWVKAKMSGTRQLMGVMLNNYSRPIESAMESNRLVLSAETCEGCHARGKSMGPRLRVISKFQDDAANTRSETVLMMRIDSIHGAHLGPGVRILYAASDKKRQTIPWVEYENLTKGIKRTYVAADAKPDAVGAMPAFEMQCVDCHNRAAHSFERADRAVDDAIAHGEIPVALPFAKKTALALLTANYLNDAEAAQKITGAFPSAGQTVLAIYQRNVFPDLKVTWGTYPNNLGHMDDPGCFRCHDDNHAASDKKTITQDCTTCHQALAVDETSPEILKSLGLGNYF